MHIREGPTRVHSLLFLCLFLDRRTQWACPALARAFHTLGASSALRPTKDDGTYSRRTWPIPQATGSGWYYAGLVGRLGLDPMRRLMSPDITTTHAVIPHCLMNPEKASQPYDSEIRFMLIVRALAILHVDD